MNNLEFFEIEPLVLNSYNDVVTFQKLREEEQAKLMSFCFSPSVKIINLKAIYLYNKVKYLWTTTNILILESLISQFLLRTIKQIELLIPCSDYK